MMDQLLPDGWTPKWTAFTGAGDVIPQGQEEESPQAEGSRQDRHGAGEGARTLDFDLGKVALYH